MRRTTIAQRLKQLESRVTALEVELHAAPSHKKDWRRTIGAFTGDPGMQEIFREAMRLRAEDRKKTRT